MRLLSRQPARRVKKPLWGVRLHLEELESRVVPSATLLTNKVGFAPAETAVITGSGFQPGETIDLTVVNQTTGATYTAWSVTDGGTGDKDGLADGNVVTSWLLPDDA